VQSLDVDPAGLECHLPSDQECVGCLAHELGCAFQIFFPFRTGLIFRNPPDSADSSRFRGTHVGIKSSRARLICPKSDGIRPESGGKDN